MRKLVVLIICLLVLISCSNLRTANTTIPKLKLLSSFEIPLNQIFQETKIGGLSGIDYDAENNKYYLISDDRSIFNDSRFYTAAIPLHDDKVTAIDFLSVTTLKNETGTSYGNWTSDPNTAADPEDIRLNPKTNSLIWSSEGARILNTDKIVLQNPSINSIDLKGNFQYKLQLPSNLEIQNSEKGPRNNATLEGIAFDKKFKIIYSNVEEPLFEDGNGATPTEGAWIRLFQFDAKTKQNTAQYGYKLDPVALEPNPKGAFFVNGISAIQFYKKNQLLVVERSYSTGNQACTIKLFLCDLKNATDIKTFPTIKDQKFEVASKKLILNMDDLGIFIDNIEGITFGPKLSNGHQSLLFVSDNNFSSFQKTQILFFEVME